MGGMSILDSTLAAYVKKLSLSPGDVLVVDPERVSRDVIRDLDIGIEFVVPVVFAPGLSISRMTLDEAVRSLQALVEMAGDGADLPRIQANEVRP